jgi:hypothetical protein
LVVTNRGSRAIFSLAAEISGRDLVFESWLRFVRLAGKRRATPSAGQRDLTGIPKVPVVTEADVSSKQIQVELIYEEIQRLTGRLDE